jgi:hypothetical protein
MTKVTLRASGKKICPLWETWPPEYLALECVPPTWTLTWMCGARPA